MGKIPDNVKNIVFVCSGGLGKNILATAVVRAIKKQYPSRNLIVMAGYPDVFMNNPNVKKVYNFNNPLYFFEDYFSELEPNSYVINVEPYLNYDYISHKKHLIEAWCDDIGVEVDGLYPEITFLTSELKMAEEYIANLKKQNKDKPICLVQWVGGKVPDKPNDDGSFSAALTGMYKRAIPQKDAQILVNELKSKYTVGVIGNTNYPKLDNTVPVFFPIRQTIALFKYADKIISIDSFTQHACAAKGVDAQAVVVWGGTSHKTLGYESNINIYSDNKCKYGFPCHRPNSYLFDITPTGGMWECSENEICMTNLVPKILSAIK